MIVEIKVDYMEINKIIDYYNDNYSCKVFYGKLVHDDKEFYLMYIYNYQIEYENFSQTFLKYLPFYVRNQDQITALDETRDLETQLLNRSKSIWKDSKLIPNRQTKMNGLYGELFLDYYLRIVKKHKAFITYASKRAFASFQESKGIDNVIYYIDNNKINICFCEAKFVEGASNASNSLIHDIEGDQNNIGHVSAEYLNSYFQFIVEKGANVDAADKAIIQPFINELNAKLDNGNDFISVLINKDICVNFIFFAIFNSKKRKPGGLYDYYNLIHQKCEEHIKNIGFSNFKIEIVFIPTENKPIDIKKEIDKAYE